MRRLTRVFVRAMCVALVDGVAWLPARASTVGRTDQRRGPGGDLDAAQAASLCSR